MSYLRRLFSLNDTPERIALAFSLGVFLSLSPLVGLQTILGLTLAFVFGLNRIAVLIGLLINNPWTLIPIYAAATYLGGLFLGVPSLGNLPEFGWRRLWEGSYWLQLGQQWEVLKPLILGSLLLSVIGALLSYPSALYLARQQKSQQVKARITG